MKLRSEPGFSLLELVITVALAGFAIGAASVLLANQASGNLTNDAQIMAYRIQDAQARALAGLNGMSWGIHIDNATTTPFYAVFPGASYAAASTTYYLSGLVRFATPVAGTTTDIVFAKLTGATSGTSTIVLQLRSDASQQKTITVSPQGQVTVQ